MRRPVRVLVALVGALSLFALPGVAAAHGPAIRGVGAPAPANAPFPVMQQNFRLLANLPQPAHTYGRCVWACDNDVVDHPVVSLRYANGTTACQTMTGLHPHA